MHSRGMKPEPGRLLSTRKSWDDLALPLSVLTDLKRLISGRGAVRPRIPTRQYGPNPWAQSRFMFCGPPGAGKSLAAQLMARDLGVAMWKIPSAALVGRHIGETEKNLARVFKQARRSGWILYFDEADALFGRRGGVNAQNSRYANREVLYLLRRAERYRGVVIVATRSKPRLGRPLQRRIAEIVEFS